MKERYYVGAYWLARREPADASARRAEAFFQLLATCDASLAHWFAKGWTLEEALTRRFGTDAASILEVFSQRAVDGGFSLGCWNGETHEAASVSLHCGNASVWVSNLCLVDLPDEGSAMERLFQAPTLAQVLRAMVVVWEPEWGVVSSDALRNLQTESGTAGTFMGWVTYFSRRRGPLPSLPSPVRVEPVEDKGSLVILTPDRFSTSNTAHVELARTVAGLLDQAGLLGPLKPWDG
ncbi:immunity 52 family protein [Archangium sp.]|jgi:hypothetical protein|uniref:immunity 52 family protein n=1 Tax=Archangium sp. TaxID=1872627 RepID=UPI002ED88319